MRRLKIINTVVLLVMLAALGVLVYTVFRQKEETQEIEKRNDTIDIIMSQVDAGASEIWVDPNAFAVPGEEGSDLSDPPGYDEYANWIFEEEEGLIISDTNEVAYIPTPTKSGATLITPVSLTVLGSIRIPAIDLSLPIYEGAGKTQLRYGIGQLSGSAQPNQDGNCVLMGHNMRTYGALFGRLDEVVVGNEVTLKGADGTEQTYTVTSVWVVTAEQALDYMYNNEQGRTVTMVSCENIRTNRRIVVAELATETPS
jgi:LPXTG-site transpeptidase (sortase) family protein